MFHVLNWPVFALLLLGTLTAGSAGANANRLTYLDGSDPFYPGLHFPKLTTPQWIGEAGVEAVVILAIDDMREPARYEAMLRPIIERLKKIDGRAPVSIYCNTLVPTNQHYQLWLKEGLSLEVHTLTHPCPLLANGNFQAAADTYHGCVDLVNQIPGNKAVAFRMPCCDSMNSPSPRFYAEMFNRTSASGQFLTIDSSVMNITTSDDKSLPRQLVLDNDGRERFRKYLPPETNATVRVSMKSFATTIENYPYPYVVNRLGWQFPAMVPSDWEARNLHGDNNPTTVADWKAALDATVLKQGTFTFIFHPHGWIRPEQMVDFIDYATAKYGRGVKFLNFREAQERLDRSLLDNNPLRPNDGSDNGVRLLDVNNDGYVDVVIGNDGTRKTRIWHPATRSWTETAFGADARLVRFGVHSDGNALALSSDASTSRVWHFDGKAWVEQPQMSRGLIADGKAAKVQIEGRDGGVRFRDADNDGQCELIVSNPEQNAVLGWSELKKTWQELPYELPKNTAIVGADGRDAGLRFVDVNEDGVDDILFSDPGRSSLHQFVTKANPRLQWNIGWNDQVFAGTRKESQFDVPPIVRGGTSPDNGVWFRSGHMWIQNEDTAHLPDKIDRRSFKQLLTAAQPPAKSPEEALAAFQVSAGFTLELVASEPLVTDPIAFEWSADGRLWVVDMHDYPTGRDGKGATGGMIRVLTDTNHDGRYDHSSVFLDSLATPTGIYPWRQGVVIASAPDILYAEDSDGDGKADVRRRLFTGFTQGNPQHLVNGFEYGLDGWLYGANGDSGGNVRAADETSGQRINISGRDFRFKPDKLLFEAIEGQTQYGRRRDDWGNWFGNNNPAWLWHYYLPERYLARNTQLPVRTTKRMLANGENDLRCFPISRLMQRFNDHGHANRVTSANSPTPYRDTLFGPDFATSVFISEPVHNLVHREVLEPDGVSFRSRRADDERTSEFLASSDNWFRPTMLKTGPDGALYIADMYRMVIEHPEWITKDIQSRLDLRAGSEMGRIYRVYPRGATLRKIPDLAKANTLTLVAALGSSNGWERDTAQRLLIERGDVSAAPALRDYLRHTETNSALSRLHALYTLHGLGQLALGDLVAAWPDSHAGMREHAVKLSETFAGPIDEKLSAGEWPEFRRLFTDPSVRVSFQLALSLGELGSRAGEGLLELEAQHPGDPALQTAILSSAPRHLRPLLKGAFAHTRRNPPAAPFARDLVRLAVAAGNEALVLECFASALALKPKTEWAFASLGGLFEALEQRKQSLDDLKDSKGKRAIEETMQAARDIARSQSAAANLTRAALGLLGREPAREIDDINLLGKLLEAKVDPDVQAASLRQLSRSRQIRAAQVLLEHWPQASPMRRSDILNAVLGRSKWIPLLAEHIEEGRISAFEIGTTHRPRLLAGLDEPLHGRVETLFAGKRADRKALLSDYAQATQLAGDANRGANVFRQQCSLCHRFKGEGVELGPDLGSITSKTPEALLIAVLDPNAAIESRYINYLVSTKSGRDFSGVITSENANSITLKAAGGAEESILRADLLELRSTGLSMMPEGLETAIPPHAMADLITYLLPH